MAYGNGYGNENEFTTDGQGGIIHTDGQGMSSATSGHPVDNLINLASELAKQDGE